MNFLIVLFMNILDLNHLYLMKMKLIILLLKNIIQIVMNLLIT